jgi:hypothetical protein
MKITLINSIKKAIFLLFFQLVVGKIMAQERPLSINNLIQNKDTGIIVCMVESMPEFKGGVSAMFKFISSNLHFKSDSTAIDGTIYVGFVIEMDGQLTDVKIKRGLSTAQNEEVVRVVKMMPGMWTHGYQDGKPVRVSFTLPIKIRLE